MIIGEVDFTEKIKKLDSFSQRVIRLRYKSDKTQKEVGDILGVHPKLISRIERRIIRDLRDE